MKHDIYNLILDNNDESNGLLINDLNKYVDKLFLRAKIIAIHENGSLNGFIAYYKNDIINKKAFLSLIIVNKEVSGKGIGSFLIESALSDLKTNSFKSFSLEVLKSNGNAIKFYEKYGFKITSDRNVFWEMNLDLKYIKK